MVNRETIRHNLENSKGDDNADMKVLKFLHQISDISNLTLLEVGCGMCKFVKKLKSQFPNMRITCIDINPKSIEIARVLGCEVICDDILNVPLQNKFDIVHCSHVIEHFKYPEVTKLLDFLVESVKKTGVVIIRTPLLWEQFYFDIDHVRPYPPQAILNYYNMEQQQKQGKFRVQVVKLWFITKPVRFKLLQSWNLCYHIPILHGLYDFLVNHINGILWGSWKRFRYPSTRPKTYVMAFRIDTNNDLL